MISKERILEVARTLYSVYGVYSVTMDDLALECGVSKRSIYNLFRHKDDIVLELTRDFISFEKNRFRKITLRTKEPVDNLKLLLEETQNMYRSLTPAVEQDLKKHFQDAWSLIQKFEEEITFIFIQPVIEDGIKKGHFKKDLSIGLHSKLICKLCKDSTRKNEFTKEIDSTNLMVFMRSFIISGLVTLKGWLLVNDSELTGKVGKFTE